jgi:hypothetical protein
MVAVRVVVGFAGDAVWVVGEQVVETVAPLSGTLGDLGGRSGFWCELRDGDGRVLHRQVLRDPRHPTDEVAGARHVPSAVTEGVFTVLVPAGGAVVALVRRRSTDPAPWDVLRHELT